jgi:hypothetical protein
VDGLVKPGHDVERVSPGLVMPALVAGIHALKECRDSKGVDARDKPAHDGSA